MPRGMYKSGRLRKVFVKTPGGKVNIHYRERRVSKASCAECGKTLAGVPREGKGQISKFPKSARRPERPYGGKLCSSCMRLKFRVKAREER